MNDTERILWVNNDESLYNWWKSTKESLRVFVRTQREALDTYIKAQLARKPSR